MWFVDMFRRRSAAAKVKEPACPTGAIVPACGDATEHDFWANEGWPCPVCAGRQHRSEKLKQIADHEAEQYLYREEMASAVADAVVERLRKEGLL